jgi:hypothetical protein
MTLRPAKSSSGVKPGLAIIFFLCWLNGVAFFFHPSLIGGGASNGRIADGRYYVASHGHYTEVTRPTYLFCWWHELSLVPSVLTFLFLAANQAFRTKR